MKSPSIRQKKTLENLAGNGGKLGPAMREAGYSEDYVNNPQKLAKTKTWEELLEQYLPDDKLARKIDEGLEATRIQTSPTEGDKVVKDFAVIQRYVETALKVKGKIVAKNDFTSNGKTLKGLVQVETADENKTVSVADNSTA